MYLHSASQLGNNFHLTNSATAQSVPVQVDGCAERHFIESFVNGNSAPDQAVCSVFDRRIQSLGKALEKAPEEAHDGILGPSWQKRELGSSQHLYENKKNGDFSEGANQVLVDPSKREVLVAFQGSDESGGLQRQEVRVKFGENWVRPDDYSETVELSENGGRWILNE
jgi:hypothetical protein